MDLSGTNIGQYKIVEKIGQGGMATVYKAHQASLDRYVAIKIMASDLSQSEDFAIRFEREARAIAKLRHRNILTVYDYGRQDDMLYLAMEYIDGGTLKERLKGPQTLSYAVDITAQIGSALAHAHRQGVVHRDIKPANVLVANEDWLILSDFGLVKMAEESMQLTMSGASLGTPQYMSPEQAQAMEIDQRSDIYSLGVMLYEAITGQTPFGTDNPVAIIMKHINEPIIPPHTLRPDLPRSMERVILKALEKSPEDRYQRMDDFLEDLQAAQAAQENAEAEAAPNGSPARREPVAEQRVAPAPPRMSAKKKKSRRTRRRRSAWLGWAILIILLLIAGLSYITFKDSMTALASALGESGALPPAVSELVTPPTLTATATTASVEPTATATADPVEPTATPVEATSAATEFTPATTSAVVTPTVSLDATPTPVGIISRRWEADGAEMVFIPAGEFMMGSDRLGDDEQPARPVYLDDFWLDRYEVTNAQFARFIDESGYETEAEQKGWGWVFTGDEWEAVNGADWQHPSGLNSGIGGKDNHPVALVSWDDAQAYCRWADKRLPTEAEWEKAARGPVSEPEERLYAWGDQFETALANTEEGGYDGTTPVGTFSPQGDSPYGAADMTGNVWEWVADWYDSDYYQTAPTENPPGPLTGTDKVVRGGSWLFDQLYAQTAFRYNIRPDYTYDFTGFRCSRSE